MRSCSFSPPAVRHSLLTACASYSVEGLEGKGRRTYLEGVVAGLEARTRGELDASSPQLAASAEQGGNPALSALAIDVLYEGRQCEVYGERVATAQEAVRALITDPDARVDGCDEQPTVEPGDNPVATADGLSASAQPVGPPSRALEWGLMGGGGAALVAAGVLMGMRSSDLATMQEAKARFNQGIDTAASFAEHEEAQAAADNKGLMATVAAVAGVGLAGTGALLLFMADEDDGAAPGEGEGQKAGGVSLRPIIVGSGIVILGRF